MGSAYGLRWAIMACAPTVLISWLAALPLPAGSDSAAYMISEPLPGSGPVATENNSTGGG